MVPSDQLKTTTLGELKKQQPSHANQIIHTAAEEAPASSKHGPVAAPNDLSSPVHARPDLSVKMTTKAGSVPAASSFQDQQPSSRGLQLSGNEHMRKSMHGSRKKTKVPGARRFCHHWCHYGVCKVSSPLINYTPIKLLYIYMYKIHSDPMDMHSGVLNATTIMRCQRPARAYERSGSRITPDGGRNSRAGRWAAARTTVRGRTQQGKRHPQDWRRGHTNQNCNASL